MVQIRIFRIIISFATFYSLVSISLYSQSLKQSVTGIVEDEDSELGISEVGINIYSADKIFQSQTNYNGSFIIPDVPIGKIRIVCKHKAYQTYFTNNIRISSGKSLVLTIKMKKKAFELEEVVISDKQQQKIHEVSKHHLNMSLGNNFAGALSDPARMMARFAGVTNPDDLRNNLVVRGNSPAGVKWNIEGITTINPNHFATAGNSGGGVNILNAYTLKDIDLYTGAFPAEFGNATSGAVDVSLRKGHLHKRKSMLRTNIIDVELATEGLISKGRSSYLIAFRRANMDVAYNISPTLRGYLGNTPNVKDLTFHLFFQGQKSKTTFYGIGGDSELRLRNSFGDPHRRFFGLVPLCQV